MSPEVQDLVDRGNEAQRAGSYEEALGFYSAAVELAPEHPVPQFGALMAAIALGDEAMVDSLSERLQNTAPELLSMLNPDGSMGGGTPSDLHTQGMSGGRPPTPERMTPMPGLPQGHPTLYEVGPTDTAPPDTVGR